MVVLIRDERTAERVLLTGIGAVLARSARQFISPNDVKLTYYSWACIRNCIQPEFQWFSLLKEKYELTKGLQPADSGTRRAAGECQDQSTVIHLVGKFGRQ